MKVLINRKRPGKKIVDAPRSIQVYDGNAEQPWHEKNLIARIEFFDEGSSIDPVIMIHSRGQITVIAYENQRGGKIEIKESASARWAEIQPPIEAKQ